MPLSSNPHVNDRSKYSPNNELALLEAIKDAGAGGIPITDLFGPYGERHDVLEHVMEAIVTGFVDIQWTTNTDDYGLVLAEQRLRDTDKDDLPDKVENAPALR